MEYMQSKNSKDKYPHMIVLTPGSEDRLTKFSKLAQLTNDVLSWITENIGENDDVWVWSYSGIIGFKYKEDAMGFLLRWG